MQLQVTQLLQIALVLSSFACATFAQGTPNPRVMFQLFVEDSRGQPVIGAAAESLVLSEHRRSITNFEVISANNIPLKLGILIDISNSQRDLHLDAFLRSAKEFAAAVLARTDGRVFFEEFTDQALATGWLASSQIASVPATVHSSGGSAIYDSLISACNQMGSQEWNNPSRRIIILITDGEDDASTSKEEDALTAAVRSGIAIFALATPSATFETERGEKRLKEFASRTGGRLFRTKDDAELKKALNRIDDLLDAMYMVKYEPVLSGKKKYHEVDIKSASRERLGLYYPRREIPEQ